MLMNYPAAAITKYSLSDICNDSDPTLPSLYKVITWTNTFALPHSTWTNMELSRQHRHLSICIFLDFDKHSESEANQKQSDDEASWLARIIYLCHK